MGGGISLHRSGILKLMMEKSVAGFRELEHTADWQLEVWAPDLPGLFAQAALGMYELSGIRLDSASRVREELELESRDHESLLVEFLHELLYLGESQGLAFDEFNIKVEDARLSAQVSGAPIAGQNKEIKAVTYHDLKIQEGPRGLEAKIVFDV